MAAGVLIAREAGAEVTRYDGGAFVLEGGEMLATNRLLHPEMLGVIAGARGA
jgi:myo-inositol-1(or 4)-monophosphatase